MFAYEKFEIFDEIVSSLPSGSTLTYSPLLREGFLFCLENCNKTKNVATRDIPMLSGVDSFRYPEKRKIKKVGYFYDKEFLSNILKGFEAQEVATEKLDLIPAKLNKVLSNKQREEIDFFDHHLQTCFDCDIRNKLEERFHLVNAMIPLYYNVLKKSGVDALLLRVYYGLNYFPIIFACKMLGITVIDVQHGINGLKHPAYSRFKTSEINSPFLPDIFWTWSSMATKMLVDDSALPSTRLVVEGGNPVFKNANNTSVSDMKLDNKKGSRILYTHQPQSKGIPVPVETIKKVYHLKGQKVAIRPHPLHLDEAKDAHSILTKAGVKCILEDPRKTSINESLTKSSIHVTYSSTCALDALNFGIPSVYCSEYIGAVESKFSTGLLLRPEEISKERLTRDSSKAIDFSIGTKEKIHAGILKLLTQNTREAH